MCLAVPMKVTAIDGEEIVVELHGVTQRARRDLLDGVRVGDHVIVHAGYAIAQLDDDEAQATLDLLGQLEPGDAVGG